MRSVIGHLSAEAIESPDQRMTGSTETSSLSLDEMVVRIGTRLGSELDW